MAIALLPHDPIDSVYPDPHRLDHRTTAGTEDGPLTRDNRCMNNQLTGDLRHLT